MLFFCFIVCVSIRSILSIVLFKSAISLLIFCLDDLSIVDSGIKTPNYYCIAVYFSF